MRERVFISGMGVVSSLGSDIESFWARCLNGDTVVSDVPSVWKNYYQAKSRYWSPLPAQDYASLGFKRSDLISFDPVVLNGIRAAENALTQAGIERLSVDPRTGRFEVCGFDPYRCGVFMGTGLGCVSSTLQNYVPHLLGGQIAEAPLSEKDQLSNYSSALGAYLNAHPRVLPVASTKSMSTAIGAQLSIRLGLKGINETCVSACAAGTSAIARAYKAVAYGELDLVLAGGSEYYGDEAGGVFMAFDRLGALTRSEAGPESANRPFDVDRSGFLFSQGGAGVLVIESEKSVRARSGRPIAEIRGAAWTSDAHSLVALDPAMEATKRMIKNALREAELEYSDIAYVNAHGTGTQQNDEVEAALIGCEFPHGPVVNSTKSLLGHTIGASGAIEAIVSALSVSRGEVHPSLNIERPVSDLNFALRKETGVFNYAISQSFGFGGHNIGVILGRV